MEAKNRSFKIDVRIRIRNSQSNVFNSLRREVVLMTGRPSEGPTKSFQIKYLWSDWSEPFKYTVLFNFHYEKSELNERRIPISYKDSIQKDSTIILAFYFCKFSGI
ncbi:hypothetical protein BpHYR1_038515 [Brachionus plicatilis]|uniref:Uncharacterized protein n=1 Tax=Brachionus plicatilis TaxID=10195 RepID=A0A3M7PEW9_BRAPC|nr:hypothetical protein BpHYR1_038515 [Brachionus plicatilis]